MITLTRMIAKELSELLKSAEAIWIASALISQEGLSFIQKRISSKTKQKILVGVNLPTSPEVLEKLLETQKNNPNFDAKLYSKRFYHPKLYIIKTASKYHAIVGSGNCTRGGLGIKRGNLKPNLEISVRIDEQNSCKKLLAYFNEHFEEGESLSSEYIEGYRVLFNKRKEREKEDKNDYDIFISKQKKTTHDKYEEELDIKIFNGRTRRKDKEYLEWINDNPEKFILNLDRNGSYAMIHKANCDSIGKLSKEDKRILSYTHHKRIKIASNKPSMIQKYYLNYHVSNSITKIEKCTLKKCGSKLINIFNETLQSD